MPRCSGAVRKQPYERAFRRRELTASHAEYLNVRGLQNTAVRSVSGSGRYRLCLLVRAVRGAFLRLSGERGLCRALSRVRRLIVYNAVYAVDYLRLYELGEPFVKRAVLRERSCDTLAQKPADLLLELFSLQSVAVVYNGRADGRCALVPRAK